MIAGTVVVAVLIFGGAWQRQVVPPQSCLGQTITLSVRVTESEERVVLTVENGDLPEGTQVVFYPSDPELTLAPQDRFTSSFVLDEYTDGTPFSRMIRRASGVWLRAKRVDMEALQKTLVVCENPTLPLFVRVRNALAQVPMRKLQGDIGAVVAGICYGVDEQLSDTATEAFRACGVSHLFSVSGLHMTVLLQALRWLLRRMRVKHRVRPVISVIFLLGFMATVGFEASVVRSGTLCLVVLLGDGIKRQADTRNSLGLALLILLLVDPFAAYDVGLLLSFAATYGLLCWTRPIQAFLMRGTLPPFWERIRRPIAMAVAVSLAAMLATLPIMAIYFGRVSLITVVANLFTTLPAEVALIAGLLGSVLSIPGITVLSEPLILIAGVAARYLLWLCEKFSTFSFATVAIGASFLLLWIVGVCVVCRFGFRALGSYGRAALLGACAAILCVGILLNRGARYDSLRIASASKEDLAITVAYRGSTVAVLAPTNVQSLYRLRDELQAQAIMRVDVLCLIGGKEPVLSYVPSVLGGYLSEHTQVLYDSLPWHPPLDGQPLSGNTVMLGDALTVQRCGEHLELVWGDHTVLFGATEPMDVARAADAVCGVGETPIMVMTKDGPLFVPAECGPVVYRSGQWLC